jgi:hypothetical protein
MAYTADLYDTPDGHLDPGYTLATSSSDTGTNIAQIIGTQSWADCHDPSENIYEIKLTPTQYADLGQPGGALPQGSLTLAQTSADDTSKTSELTQPVVSTSASTTATTTPTIISLPIDGATASSSSNEAVPVGTSTPVIGSDTIDDSASATSTNVSTTTPSN